MSTVREGYHSEIADSLESDLCNSGHDRITSVLLGISQRLEELIQELRRGREASVQR